MLWQEDDEKERDVIADDIVDLAFSVAGRTLPVDHAYTLSAALQAALPWLTTEPLAGIHQIHVAESGNGWYRPEDTEGAVLHLSRRTRMTLRLPAGRNPAARALTGRTLNVDGHDLEVGKSTVKPLNPLPTLFSRYVVGRQEDDEEAFVAEAARRLTDMGIRVRKLLCGRSHQIRTPQGPIFTRSMMVAELDKVASAKLQRTGLGPERALGCGLFVPHKGIGQVRDASNK